MTSLKPLRLLSKSLNASRRQHARRAKRRRMLVEKLGARVLLAGDFSDISAGLPDVEKGSVAWGDYDNDGDLDILLTGSSSGSYISRVYRQDSSGSFSDISAGLTGVYRSSVAWGDYDNDGDLDILLTGVDANNYLPISRVYRQESSGSFSDISAALPGVERGSVAWGDYDNDGDLDILLTGRDPSSNYISRVYQQDSSGSFNDISAGLYGAAKGSVAWGDYDNDGDLDILLTGDNPYVGSISRVYRQDSSGSFSDISAGLEGVAYASVAWGDYDNDGDLDILLTGRGIGSFNLISRVYRQDSGSFSDISAGLPGVRYSSVAWGDYDNDGDLDILLTGRGIGSFNLISRVYSQDSSGSFSDISAGLDGVYRSSVAWGDYDNDGDLDILLTGRGDASVSFAPIARVYRNDVVRPDAFSFSDISAGLAGVRVSSVAWGDYDNDGDLDILLTGSRDNASVSSATISRVYRQDSSGSFSDISAGLEGVRYSSVAWGDYDNDGDLDILLTGRDASGGPISRVYRQDSSGSFSDISAGLTGVSRSSVAWGDYDNDGDLDILLTGRDASAPASRRSTGKIAAAASATSRPD